jgi:hypothetical protein
MFSMESVQRSYLKDNRRYQGVTAEKSASLVRASMKLEENECSELVRRQEARKQVSELGLGAQKKISGQPAKN